jgi:hypothetical protein
MPSATQAQEEENLIPEDAVVVADVRITDVVFAEDDGVIRGTFVLSNLMGIQTGITYGITAQDEKYRIVDSVSLGKPMTLEEGDSVQVDFTYTIPSYIEGMTSFVLVAKTDKGLILSVQPLLARVLSSSIVGFSCERNTEADEVACTSDVDTTLNASFFRGSEFAAPIMQQSVALPAGVPVSLELPKEPGRYILFARDGQSNFLYSTAVRVLGSYGDILNTVASTDDNNVISGVTAVQVSPFVGSSVTVSLLEGGVSCAKEEYQLSDFSLEWSLTPECPGDEVLVQLFDKSELLLAQIKVPLTIEPDVVVPGPQPTAVSDTSCCKSSTGSKVALFTLVALMSLVAYYLIGLLRKDKNPIVPTVCLLFVFGMSLHATPAEAVTIGAQAWGVSGEISYSVWVSVTPNKANYVAGDTMVINASTNVYTDAGANGSIVLTNANIAYNRDGSGVLWNEPTTIGGPVLVDPSPLTLDAYESAGPFNGSSVPITVPALPLGSNYVLARLGFQTSVSAPVVRTGNMTFNMVAPPACAPSGSLYSWNGSNWDDFGTPSWSPGNLTGYGMSNQGPLLSGPTTVSGTVSGVMAYAVGYPNRAWTLRCGAVAPSVQVNFR